MPSPQLSGAAGVARRLIHLRRWLVKRRRKGQVTDLLRALEALDSTLAVALRGVRRRGGMRFDGDLNAARTHLKAMLDQSPDLIVRSFWLGKGWRWPALIAFVDGLSDNEMIDQDTVQRLMDAPGEDPPTPTDVFDAARTQLITAGHLTTTAVWSKIETKVLSGNAAVFVAGNASVILVDTVKYPARAIPATNIEPAVRGPQEAFNEVGLTHMDQLRRWIRSPLLHFDQHTVGVISHTPIMVAYLDGIVNQDLLARVIDRVEGVNRDVITRANDLAEYLVEHRFSLFPQYRLSDRVDWVARELAQGKIAILVDNDPFSVLLPMTLMDFYKTSQDYSVSWWDGTLVRIIRLVALLLGLYLMPLYIALTSVNLNLMPTMLLLTIDGSRAGVPFPPVAEVVIMYVIIEILREAANRLPKELAVTLGTVGAVVVGTAIVRAGIVDDVMIVSATLTALGLFTTPSFEMSTPWRWLFWVMVIGAYALGVFGILLVTVGIVAYLAGLEPFGIPYLTPFGPLRTQSWADAWIRAPMPNLLRRPTSARPEIRQAASSNTPPDRFHLRPPKGSSTP